MGKELIDKLIEIQKDWELSNKKMGRRLNVSAQRWQYLTKNPEKFKNIVSPILRGILTNFPEFEKDMIQLIKGSNGNGSH